ncbi:MAG TPA: hypothetical protein VGE69_05445 [Pseudomonadales bacterium]
MSTAALDAEVQRLQCLQALGIAVYHPRFRLPGAKPSVQGPWPDARMELPHDAGQRSEAERAAPVEMPSRDDRRAAERPREDDAPSMARTGARITFDAPTAAPTVVPPAVPQRRPASGAVPVQNFQLLFLQVDADLAIVNQIPALSRPQLQDRQLALLTNLLRWLGKSVPAQPPRVFRWPLPGLEHMAASMSADTSLLHFLEQACTERSFRYLLQLGPQAIAAASPAWQSFATHSLDEMLALPVLKREAWQALMPLHVLLHANA